MPASRSVVSVLLRELGDFSLHPQGRPCGRPPQAAALGPAGTVRTSIIAGPHEPTFPRATTGVKSRFLTAKSRSLTSAMHPPAVRWRCTKRRSDDSTNHDPDPRVPG
jgi:hypothetical protein